jgi:hypothetical protein
MELCGISWMSIESGVLGPRALQCELQTHLCARLGLYALQGELYTQGSCIVQQKGKEALGLNKDRESNNDLNFGYTWLKTLKKTYG